MIPLLEKAKLNRKHGSRRAKEGPKEAKNAIQGLRGPSGRAQGVYSMCCAQTAAPWERRGISQNVPKKSDKFREYLVKIRQKSIPAGRKGQFGGPGPKKVPKRVDPPAVLGPKIRSNSQKMRKKWYQKIVCFSDRAREGYFSDFWRFLGEKGSEK